MVIDKAIPLSNFRMQQNLQNCLKDHDMEPHMEP